jgi:hypothetical protein
MRYSHLTVQAIRHDDRDPPYSTWVEFSTSDDFFNVDLALNSIDGAVPVAVVIAAENLARAVLATGRTDLTAEVWAGTDAWRLNLLETIPA